MKTILHALLLAIILLTGCKKDNNNDDDASGGGNGGGSGSDPGLTGRYIIKTQELCPAGTSNFIGYKQQGALDNYEITFSSSDTLNSWYLQKSGADKYLLYAKMGSAFLIWKQGAQQPFLNTYSNFQLRLERVTALPLNPGPEMLMGVAGSGGSLYSITSANGYKAKTYKGGRKNTGECSISGVPIFFNITGCMDVQQNADLIQYCFQEDLVFQKIN